MKIIKYTPLHKGEVYDMIICPPPKKLLLINPWQTYKKHLESEYQSYIPYGLTCIASIGIQQGFDTKIVDCLEDETRTVLGEFVRFGKGYDELKTLIEEYNPDIVGISSTFSMFENDATEVAKLVKQVNRNAIVILGGVTATLQEIYEPLFQSSDVYDIMVRGEGEDTFSELLQNYNHETCMIDSLHSIKGIAYKINNSVITTKDRPFIFNLDSLPFPALHLLNLDKVYHNKYFCRWRNNPVGKRSMPIFTSRGCPYNCCFCSVHSQVGYRHRIYSVDYVVELMKKCINEYGINHFHFEDDNLTFDVKRAKLLFREIAKLNVTWDTPNGIRADRLDEEMLKLMISSGITSLSIAAESGNEEVRQHIIHKNLKTENIVKAVQLCDQHNLPCIVFFVLGFPGETMDTIRESVIFAKGLSETYNTINMIFIANPLPGTELNKVCQNNGYISKKLSNSDYFVAIRANQAPIIETDKFSKREIFELLKDELDNSCFSVHNIAQPMFWADNEIASMRAKRVFPKMTNKKNVWMWVE